MAAKILIVEDEEALVTLISYYLEAAGYGVISAVTSDDARFLLKESPSITPTITDTPAPTATFTPMPLPTPNGIYSRTLRVPILMYHYISVPPEDADIYRLDLSVDPEMFRAQMQYLAENGYSTIDLYDLSLAITNKIELPPKPVIITLDDGYVDNYWYAFPILQEFGLKATFFVMTEFIDDNNPNYMSWEMVEALGAAGMRIEPHSKNHPDLSERERDFLIYQMLGSQETIAAHIGYTPRYFAYPGGRYDELAMQILDELGRSIDDGATVPKPTILPSISAT